MKEMFWWLFFSFLYPSLMKDVSFLKTAPKNEEFFDKDPLVKTDFQITGLSVS